MTISLDEIEDEIIAYVARKLRPEDVFPEDELREWAEGNGYVIDKDEENG